MGNAETHNRKMLIVRDGVSMLSWLVEVSMRLCLSLNAYEQSLNARGRGFIYFNGIATDKLLINNLQSMLVKTTQIRLSGSNN